MFGDEVLVAAIRDRLLHHSHTILIQDDSYRLKQKRKSGLLYPTLLRANSSLATAEPKAHQQQCQAARTLDAPLGVAARPAQACTGPPKPAASAPSSLGSQHVPRETIRAPPPHASASPPHPLLSSRLAARRANRGLATAPRQACWQRCYQDHPRHPAERRGAMCSSVSCSGPDQRGARRVLYLFHVNTPAHFRTPRVFLSDAPALRPNSSLASAEPKAHRQQMPGRRTLKAPPGSWCRNCSA